MLKILYPCIIGLLTLMSCKKTTSSATVPASVSTSDTGLSLLFQVEPADDEASAPALTSIVQVLRMRFAEHYPVSVELIDVAPNQILAWMPCSGDAQKAQTDYAAALAELRSTLITEEQIGQVISAKEPERAEAIAKLAAESHPRRALLKQLGDALDRQSAARQGMSKFSPSDVPDATRAELYDAEQTVRSAVSSLIATNVSPSVIDRCLSEAQDSSNGEAADYLVRYVASFPAEKAQIERYIAAWKARRAAFKGPLPEEVAHFAARRGILEFRVSCAPDDLSEKDIGTARDQLAKHGAGKALSVNDLELHWSYVLPGYEKNFDKGFILSTYSARRCILCFDGVARSLTRHAALKWSVTTAPPRQTKEDVELAFRLDRDVGARYMEFLTGNNRGRPLAVLVDDNVITAPIINATIRDGGVMTFGRLRPLAEAMRDAEELYLLTSRVPLPVRLELLSITPASRPSKAAAP